ncbi:hypothetical protein Q8F55_000694 [Vanrija albida]|uniref:Uncharacterized protein n=1 Tax=Vanrija albida TaxID=181172 RepID=A0ABR3QE09_9TREE
MSSYGATSSGGNSNTYQLVIISVIAAVIVIAAVVTLLYRRHRHQQFLRGLPAGITSVGYVLGATRPAPPPRRKKRRDFGPEPGLWDALVGEEDDSEDEYESDDESKDKLKEKELDDPEHWHVSWGKGRADAQPVAIALPAHPCLESAAGLSQAVSAYAAGTSPPPAALSMTLLIAMPDPSLAPVPDDGAYPVLRVGPHEEGALPPLQLSSTRIPVDSGWDALEQLRPPPPPKPAKPPPDAPAAPAAPSGIQRVRVDGFSRTLLRLPTQQRQPAN